MDIQSMLQSVWKGLKGAMPSLDADTLMDSAMKIGESQGIGAIMAMAENHFDKKGYGEALRNNMSWNALKKKPSSEAVSYIWKSIKEMGLTNLISSFMK